jgi:hypothetical protein
MRAVAMAGCNTGNSSRGWLRSTAPFAETLIEALEAFHGPILAYSAYELTRLKQLAEEFPDLSAVLYALIARLVDEGRKPISAAIKLKVVEKTVKERPLSVKETSICIVDEAGRICPGAVGPGPIAPSGGISGIGNLSSSIFKGRCVAGLPSLPPGDLRAQEVHSRQ